MNWFKQALWLEEYYAGSTLGSFPIFINPNTKEWAEILRDNNEARILMSPDGQIIAWDAMKKLHYQLKEDLIRKKLIPNVDYRHLYATSKDGKVLIRAGNWGGVKEMTPEDIANALRSGNDDPLEYD